MSTIPDRSTRQDLRPLLDAQSVAIVGISQPDRFGGIVYENLRRFGYTGAIYGVNPRYDTLFDRPCHPSLRALPERPDLALLAVPNGRLIEALEEVAACGIPAAALFASAYSEASTWGSQRPRRSQTPTPTSSAGSAHECSCSR